MCRACRLTFYLLYCRCNKISRTFDGHLFYFVLNLVSTGTVWYGTIGYWHHDYHGASEGSQRQAKEVGELTAAEAKRAEERREQVRKELEEKRKALDARWRAVLKMG